MRNLRLPEPDFTDLADDDRVTALRLREAFSPITMAERPLLLRGIDDPSDALTDATSGDRRPHRSVAPRPGRSRRPVLAGLVGVAAAAIAVVVIDAGPGASSGVAWAATPEPVSAVDVATATELCSGALTDAATATAEATAAGRDTPLATPALPTALPPLVTLDLRGDGGYAHFADATARADCLLVQRDGVWERGPVVLDEVRPPLDGAPIAVGASGSTTWPDATTVSFLTGTVSDSIAAQVATVELAWPDGTVATASLAGGSFAIWWPGELAGDVTIRALGADGTMIAELVQDPAVAR